MKPKEPTSEELIAEVKTRADVKGSLPSGLREAKDLRLMRLLAQRLEEARAAMREARQLCMDSPSREAIIERLDRALKDDAERSGVR